MRQCAQAGLFQRLWKTVLEPSRLHSRPRLPRTHLPACVGTPPPPSVLCGGRQSSVGLPFLLVFCAGHPASGGSPVTAWTVSEAVLERKRTERLGRCAPRPRLPPAQAQALPCAGGQQPRPLRQRRAHNDTSSCLRSEYLEVHQTELDKLTAQLKDMRRNSRLVGAREPGAHSWGCLSVFLQVCFFGYFGGGALASVFSCWMEVDTKKNLPEKQTHPGQLAQ